MKYCEYCSDASWNQLFSTFYVSLRRLKDFNTNILLVKNEREIRSILINTVSPKLYFELLFIKIHQEISYLPFSTKMLELLRKISEQRWEIKKILAPNRFEIKHQREERRIEAKIERNEVVLSPARREVSFLVRSTKQFSVAEAVFSVPYFSPPSLSLSKLRNCTRSNDIKPARNYFCPDPLETAVSRGRIDGRSEWCFQFVYLITHNCFTYTASRADASSHSP